MVATARITRTDLLPDRVRHTFADGGSEERPYRYDPAMDGVDGCDGRCVDMFPAENVLPDLVSAKSGRKAE